MASREAEAARIFLDAVEQHEPSEWPEFVRQAVAGDALLGERVDDLLRAHRQASPILEPNRLLATVASPESTEGVGALVGPYKILEQVGEGGMGLVYVAEQQQPVKRRVALKIIKPGMDSRQVVARFEAERQALALMDHPNIAKVYDGGTTPEGRPFFVMELVKGTPITDYCDGRRLTTRQRLELFVDVCHAVQHAHQKGVIHRDLKPSNVLVEVHDVRPVVKVIDFGIAKATGQQLTDKTLYTGVAQLIGTPLYMSPEQAGLSSLDVDTRSDVYSLGVLLYELLTGTTPFDSETLKKAGYDEMRRIIREDEPPRPSARLSTMQQARLSTIAEQRGLEPERLTRHLRGELDWLVMKALEKDRNRRYESASAFAADVQRYLSDEPVQACPPSVGYRLRKFARRKKATLAVISVVLFFLLSLGAMAGWLVGDHTARQRALDDEVARNLDEAVKLINDSKWPEAITAVQRAEGVLKAVGRKERPPRLLELQADLKMAQRLEDIYSQPKSDEFFWGQEQDKDYTQAFKDYGIEVDVLPLSEAAARIRARTIWRELVRALDFWSFTRRAPGGDDNRQKEGNWKGLLEIAKEADPDPWRNQLRDAFIQDDRKKLKQLAASADVRKVPPTTLSLLADSLAYRFGAPEQAVALLRRAQRQYRGDLWINNNLAWFSLTKLNPPRYDDAIRFYSAALAVRPRNPYLLRAQGRALREKGSYDESIAVLSQAIELKPDWVNPWTELLETYQRLGHPEKVLAKLSRQVGLHPEKVYVWINRGYIYGLLHEYDKALADYSKAIALDPGDATGREYRGDTYIKLKQWDKAIADCAKAIELKPDDGVLYVHLGVALEAEDKLTEAAAAFRKAIELNPYDSLPHANLGRVLWRQEHYPEAVAALRKSIELKPDSAYAHCELGIALWRQEHYPEAVAALRKSIELKPDSAYAHCELGIALLGMGKRDQAIAELRKAIELDPDGNAAYYTLRQVLEAEGKHDEALAVCRTLLKIQQAKFGPDHAKTLMATHLVAVEYCQTGRFKEAVPLLQRSLEHKKRTLGIDNEDTIETMKWLALAYYQAGRPKDALPLTEYLRTKLKPDDIAATRNLHNLGLIYYHLGRWQEALSVLERALEQERSRLGPDHELTLTTMKFLAPSLMRAGRFKDALPILETLVEKRSSRPGPADQETLVLMTELAETYAAVGKATQAERVLSDLCERLRKQAPRSREFASCAAELGLNLLKQKKYTQAEPVLRECLSVRMKQLPDHWLRFNAQSMLGEALMGQNKHAEAEPLLLQGYEGMRQRESQIPPEGKIRLTEAVERLVRLYETTNQPAKAQTWRQKLKPQNLKKLGK